MNKAVKLPLWTSLGFVEGRGYEVYCVSGSPNIEKYELSNIFLHKKSPFVLLEFSRIVLGFFEIFSKILMFKILKNQK